MPAAHGPTSGPTSEPSDNTTLSAVLEEYGAGGYAGDLQARDDGVRCSTCEAVSPAEHIEIHSLRRLEGASDPADMAAVVATACPACGTRGTLVVQYGPEASEAEVALLRRSRDRRLDEDAVPPSASPTEGGR